MPAEYNTNQEIIEDLSSKLKELERQDWQKRLITEPLKPSIEETVKTEDFSDRKYWILMDEHAEDEDYKEEKKPEKRSYQISGFKTQYGW